MKLHNVVSLAFVTLALGAFGCGAPPDQEATPDEGSSETQALTARATAGGTVSPPVNATTATAQINNGGGSGGGGTSTECTSCKISSITECANTCTPADVQRDGNCKAVIKQCIDDKCADKCRSGRLGGSVGLFLE